MRACLKKNLLIPILSTSLLISCSPSNVVDSYSFCKEVKRPCLDKKKKVAIITQRGKIIFEIDGDSAPLTAGNFLELINSGAYEGATFHRVIRSPYPFVIQAGDLRFKKHYNYNRNNYMEKKESIASTTNKNYFLPLEIKLKGEKSPRYNKAIVNASELSKLQKKHQRGALAMARSQGLNSANTQFYIALKNLPELDGRYTVFGEVIEGMNIVDEIKKGDLIVKTFSLDN